MQITNSFRVALAVFIGMAAQPAGAQSSEVLRDQSVQARLVSEASAVVPGQPFRVGLLLEHDPHWHTYWKVSATGYGTSIRWDLPEGFTASEIEWPVPTVYDFSGWIEYVYEDAVMLLVTITPPETLTNDSVELGFTAEWLMCKDVCVPGEVKGTLRIPVSTEKQSNPTEWAEQFEEFTARLPVAPADYQLEAVPSGRNVTLFVSGELPEGLYFYDDAGRFVVPLTMEMRSHGPQRASVLLQLNDATPETPERLTGVLAATGGWPAQHQAAGIFIDLPISAQSIATTAPTEPRSLLSFLLLAFAGGFILNLMPCVFPVLGIKVMGFVNQSGENKARIIQHGLMFTAGVLLSFWLLAGVLLVLRSGGEQLGWGFQLQSPGFVLFLTLFLFAFALNMSGLFEVGQSAVGAAGKLDRKSGLSGSFLSGVLATVVATPCAAPFLAPALGAALALPPVASFTVFTAIGLGLALPYLLLSAFPALTRMLPRPGPWMESFKQFMGFLLYATVAYLVWVLAGQLSEEAGYDAFALLRVLFTLVIVALALWIYGRWAAYHRPLRTRWIAGLCSLALVSGGIAYALPESPESAASRASIEWREWQPGLAAQLAAEGNIVYVDFTARWCVTCQTNKAAVFSSSEVKQMIEDEGIVLLKADWTQRDDRISQALAEFERSAVPFNLVYGPNDPSPQILPELLTPSIVLNAFKRAKGL